MIRYALAAAILMVAAPALAQTPGNVVVVPDLGTYTFKASWDPDYASVCFFRVDTGEELGCASTPEATLHSTGVEYVQLQANIPNPGVDLEVRTYATDASGNRSADSPNLALVDFTPPNPPTILAMMVRTIFDILS